MDRQLTRFEALKLCEDRAGSISQLGRDLAIAQSTMSRIINSSRQLPAEYVLQAERLYGVSRHDLRPDIYPREELTDRRIGNRFEGIDRRSPVTFHHAGNLPQADHRVDFDTAAGMKEAAR